MPGVLGAEAMRVLVSHPTGSQFVRQTLRAFEDAELLLEFWTSIARPEKRPADALLPKRLVNELRRRSYDSDILAKTHTAPLREMMRLAAIRLKLNAPVAREDSPLSIERINRHLDRIVAKRIGRGGVVVLPLAWINDSLTLRCWK